MNSNQTFMRWTMCVGALLLSLWLPSVSRAGGTLTFTVTQTTLTANAAGHTGTGTGAFNGTGTGAGVNLVKIFVTDTSADAVSNIVLTLQIADGGLQNTPNNGPNGTGDTAATGPMISNVFTNTLPSTGTFTGLNSNKGLFGGKTFTASGNGQGQDTNPNAQNLNPTESQEWEVSTNLTSGTVTTTANVPVLLAVVQIDTTGSFPAGPWALILSQSSAQPYAPGLGSSSLGSAFPIGQPNVANMALAPEPATLGLAALLVPGVLLRRRRKAV